MVEIEARSIRPRSPSAATTSSSRPAIFRSQSISTRSSGARVKASSAWSRVSGSRRAASPQSCATSSGGPPRPPAPRQPAASRGPETPSAGEARPARSSRPRRPPPPRSSPGCSLARIASAPLCPIRFKRRTVVTGRRRAQRCCRCRSRRVRVGARWEGAGGATKGCDSVSETPPRAGSRDLGGGRCAGGHRRRNAAANGRPGTRSPGTAQRAGDRDRRPDGRIDAGDGQRQLADRRPGGDVPEQLRQLLALLPLARHLPHRPVHAQPRRARQQARRTAASAASRHCTETTTSPSGFAAPATTPR